ncbi:hypothetical protein MIZ01_2497 [Sideroxyarcus emersonii]|uniref:Uncharacterized protein n=1 Tax=Sideroxyarcus emersonii TaxID=2764705 RepID=A0AAN1XBY1_9PROT|nr:hypothetical protein MIZ01_2497 [Sideroxyarcus emersonii]
MDCAEKLKSFVMQQQGCAQIASSIDSSQGDLPGKMVAKISTNKRGEAGR